MMQDNMMDEWRAWQRVVGLLRERNIDVDGHDDEELAAALVMWGEMVGGLRAEQPWNIREKAYREAVDRWNLAVAKR